VTSCRPARWCPARGDSRQIFMTPQSSRTGLRTCDDERDTETVDRAFTCASSSAANRARLRHHVCARMTTYVGDGNQARGSITTTIRAEMRQECRDRNGTEGEPSDPPMEIEMPLDWREPLSSAHTCRLGCMIAAPTTITQQRQSHNDPAMSERIDTTTINTPVGINHQVRAVGIGAETAGRSNWSDTREPIAP